MSINYCGVIELSYDEYGTFCAVLGISVYETLTAALKGLNAKVKAYSTVGNCTVEWESEEDAVITLQNGACNRISIVADIPFVPTEDCATEENAQEPYDSTMSDSDRNILAHEIHSILSFATSTEYADRILEEKVGRPTTILEGIMEDVEISSAWEDEGYYNDADIRLSIGREILDRFGVYV